MSDAPNSRDSLLQTSSSTYFRLNSFPLIFFVVDDSNGGHESRVVVRGSSLSDDLRVVVAVTAGDADGVADVEAHGRHVGGNVALHHGGLVRHHASVGHVVHLDRWQSNVMEGRGRKMRPFLLRTNHWQKSQVHPFCCCCTADSQADKDRN